MRALSVFAGIALARAAQDPPQQIHIAFDGSDVHTNDGMIVSWVTLSNTAETVVQWGSSPGALSNTATGTQSMYLPAANGGTVNHHVHVSGLSPGTTYFYQCGDASAGFSPVLNMTTSVAIGSEFPVEILAWADSAWLRRSALGREPSQYLRAHTRPCSGAHQQRPELDRHHARLPDGCFYVGARRPELRGRRGPFADPPPDAVQLREQVRGGREAPLCQHAHAHTPPRRFNECVCRRGT